MRQIIYFSTAADRQGQATLDMILAVSRQYNLRDNVTGLLVAGGYRYLQAIEGPAGVIEATMRRIRRDERHVGVTVMIDRRIAKRDFADWAMAYREGPQQDDFATLGDMIAHLRAQVSERGLRAQLDCFARSFVISAQAPVASPWTLATDYEAGLAFDRRH